MIHNLASECSRRLAEESSPPPQKRQRRVNIGPTSLREKKLSMNTGIVSTLSENDDRSIFMRRVFAMDGDRVAALRRHTDDDPDADYISYDPNRVFRSTSSTREDHYRIDDDNDANGNNNRDVGGSNIISQFPSGRQRVREFDPRAWRFGLSYSVPEQTSARYLCLGENRMSLFSRLIVRYHAHGEHWISLADALHAIDSPGRMLTMRSQLPVRQCEVSVIEPFELLAIVRPAEKRQPEFGTALIRVLLASCALARKWYVTYNDVLIHHYHHHHHHQRYHQSHDKLDWRNLEIVDFVRHLRQQCMATDNTAASVTDDNTDNQTSSQRNIRIGDDDERHHMPHILLACPIEPLEEWPPIFETDCCSPSTGVPKEVTISSKSDHGKFYDNETMLPTIDRYGADCRVISNKRYFVSPSFVDDKSLHVWLSVDIRQFYERVLPVLLCRLPHFSVYDRSCATRCDDQRFVGWTLKCRPRSGRRRGFDCNEAIADMCICVQLYNYRAALTDSVILIVLHRLVFDLRYNATQLLQFMSRERARKLFDRLMTNGFVCAALPFSYFVEADVVVSRCRDLYERIRRAPSFPSTVQHNFSNENLFRTAKSECLCRQDVLRLSNETLFHMIAVRTINSPWCEPFRRDENYDGNQRLFDHSCRHRPGYDAIDRNSSVYSHHSYFLIRQKFVYNLREERYAMSVRLIRDRMFIDDPVDSCELLPATKYVRYDDLIQIKMAIDQLVAASDDTSVSSQIREKSSDGYCGTTSKNIAVGAQSVTTLQTAALRTIVLTYGLARLLELTNVVNMPPCLVAYAEAYFRETVWYFLQCIFWATIELKRMHLKYFFYRWHQYRRPWWRQWIAPHDNGSGIVNIHEIVKAITVIKDELISDDDDDDNDVDDDDEDDDDEDDDGDSVFNGDEVETKNVTRAMNRCVNANITCDHSTCVIKRRSYDWIYHGCHDDVNASCTRRFPIAHRFDSATYNSALRYAHEGHLFVPEVNSLFVTYDDRHNFALLATLDRQTVCEYYRKLHSPTTRRQRRFGYYSATVPFSTTYATRLYIFNTCSHLERSLCAIWSNGQSMDDDKFFIPSGRVVLGDATTSSCALHRNMTALPEILHENIAWLWLQMTADDFAQWFQLARRRMRRLSAVETDHWRTASGFNIKCGTSPTTLEQRRAFATSFWYAAHNTVAFTIIVYARIERYPEEAVKLFRNIAKWSWWYSPPNMEEDQSVAVDGKYFEDGFQRAQRRRSLNKFGRGPRTDVWTLALAALFVRRQDFWTVLTRFMQIAIGELKLATQRGNPLEGYSMLKRELRVEIEKNAQWLNRMTRRLNLGVNDDDDDNNDDNDDDDNYRYDDSTDTEDSNDDDNDDDDDDDGSDEFDKVKDNDHLRAFDHAIDSWTRETFVRAMRLTGDSVICRALDCIFVLRGIYRDVRNDSSRRIELPMTIENDVSRHCCRAYRDAWNGQLCEFVDECESALDELAESTTKDFARLVRQFGISMALAGKLTATSSRKCPLRQRTVTVACQRYFSRVFWWFVATVFNFNRDLCIRCY